MALIDHRDVEAVLGVTLTPDETTNVNSNLVPWATAEMIALLNRNVEGATVVGERIPSTAWGGCDLYLAQSPVVSVEEVRVVTATSSDVVHVASYSVVPWGIRFGYWPISVTWGDQLHMEVDYTAALTDLAVQMVPMCERIMASAVARQVTEARGNSAANSEGALGVNSLSVEGYSVSYAKAPEAGGQFVATITATVGIFDTTEVQALQRLRRRVVR